MKRILFAPKDDWIDPVRDRLDAALRAQENALANVLIPSRRVVDITDDKPRFNAWLGSTGFAEFVPDVGVGERVSVHL